MRFVLVHGGFHAGWCWSRTIAELERIGHAGIAIDLPGHGSRLDEESTLANRRAAVAAVLQSGAVYRAAAPPREGRNFIRCEQDRAYPRWLADLVCRRLGVQPLTIDASHSPFLSRPAELAELLVHATTTRQIGPLIPD